MIDGEVGNCDKLMILKSVEAIVRDVTVDH